MTGNSGVEVSTETLAECRNCRGEARDIEALLIWTYQDQAADAVAGRGEDFGPKGYGNTFDAVRWLERLGTAIDCAGSAGRAPATIHEDAEAVHEAVRRLPSLAMGLVVSHAKGGTRPDWMPEGARIRPERKRDGRIVLEYNKHREPVCCPIVYDPHPDVVQYQRRLYLCWWDALKWLADELEGLAVGPEVPREPWLDRPKIR